MCMKPCVLAFHSQVIVHSPEERETVPLSIHHLPFALTFGFFGVRLCPAFQRSGPQTALDRALLALWQLGTRDLFLQDFLKIDMRCLCSIHTSVHAEDLDIPDNMGQLALLDPGVKEKAAQAGQVPMHR